MSKLNDRQVQLIKILTEVNNYLPVHEIANRLKISTKTIYRDIEKISKERPDFIFEKKQSKGIKLNVSKVTLHSLQSNKVNQYSLEERRIKILLDLLKNTDKYTSIEALSEKYYVGKSSIVNDLNFISSNLLNSDLTIEKSRKGTRVVGNEKNIRAKLVSIVDSYSFVTSEDINNNYFSDRINVETIKELSNRFSIANVSIIEDIINKYESRLPYTIGDLYYTNLVIHILIAIERITAGNYVDLNENNVATDKNYYTEANNIARDLEKNFNITFPDNEIYYIYQYLVSTGVGEINQQNNLVLEESVEEIASRFLKNIGESNLIVIDSDDYIYYVFKLHIRALIKRLKYKIKIKNTLSEKIISDYKEIFYSVRNIARETLDKDISDDEVAYLTVYVQAILESTIEFKNVVLVCHSGFGTSQFLKKRIETIFPKINIVDVISSRDLQNYSLDNISYIISTVKLPDNFTKVINVNVLLRDEDINLINKLVFGEK